VTPAHTGGRERNSYTSDLPREGMNLRLALAGACLLLASSGLFAASSAPRGLPLVLVAAAAIGAATALARSGLGRRTT
jgi:hypothetical protein